MHLLIGLLDLGRLFGVPSPKLGDLFPHGLVRVLQLADVVDGCTTV